ncbi:hypothetical protein [Nocardia asiatica]|uniref:hypothetical protein n=1 Tax=Nocardia asiatica TaxID=209252 RepID=UPI003EDEAF25
MGETGAVGRGFALLTSAELWWEGADAIRRASGVLYGWNHDVTAAQIKAADALLENIDYCAGSPGAARFEEPLANCWSEPVGCSRPGT